MLKESFLVEIPWETRNLGVPSFEISEDFIKDLDETALANNIKENKKPGNGIFVQARLQKLDTKTIAVLIKLGFYSVETLIMPYIKIDASDVLRDFMENKTDHIPRRYDLKDLRFFALDNNDKSRIESVNEIARTSFTDDRFHLDPFCDNKIADRRFVYWVDDLMGNGDVIFNILAHRDKTISFMARKGEFLILAGFAKKYVNSGLGEFFWLSVLDKMKNEGLKNAKTRISTNNTSVLNLYSRIGFKFKNPVTTYHYWNPAEVFS